MDKNEKNITDQNVRRRAVRKSPDMAGDARTAGRKRPVRRTSEAASAERRKTADGASAPMRRSAGNVRKPTEQTGRAQGSLRKEHTENRAAGKQADATARRSAGATGSQADATARRGAGATGSQADATARRSAGAAGSQADATARRGAGATGSQVDPTARRGAGATGSQTDATARRGAGATGSQADATARRGAGATGSQTDATARRGAGAVGSQADSTARRGAGAAGNPSARRTAGSGADPSTRRTAGIGADPSARRKAGNQKDSSSVRSEDGIVRRQGSRPNGNAKGKAMSKKKKKQKRAAFNFASGGVLIIAACVFIFSLYQLITMLIPYYSGGEEYDKIKDIAISADEEGKGFSVDFDALLKENEDTVAWIRFDEPAVINYPVVKSADNTEYLTKTFTANDNKLGAIFVDMRNSNDFSDKNTFIYGHHLNVGGEMFSELLEYESEAFCKKHPNFYIYTPDGKVRTYQVFSAGVVKDTADNYKLDYASDADYEAYLKLCEDSSNYKVEGVELTAQSQIVSLSTCTNVRDDERFLVQGVLTAID